jgi:DNA-binding GntR family transcriptional regulator
LTATDEVLRITRVRHWENGGIAFEIVVLPLSRFPGMGPNDVIDSKISEVAMQYRLATGLARERASTVRAGKVVAGHLHVAQGTRLLRLDRIVLTADGMPIEWRVSFAVPSP